MSRSGGDMGGGLLAVGQFLDEATVLLPAFWRMTLPVTSAAVGADPP